QSAAHQGAVWIAGNGTLRQNPLLTEVLFPELEELDTVRIELDFAEESNRLNALIDVPKMAFSGATIDSVFLYAHSDAEAFRLDLGLQKAEAGPITITQTVMNNEISDGTVFSHFQAQHQDQNLMEFKTEI